ncbi:MAG: PTS transporter subunit EIIA [bacterium]|nr:PTS transporter subunit EIIA [bacterium]
MIYDALMEREKLGSTGFGDGLAIPHAKLENIDTFGVVMITLKKGVDYDSIDKKKVKVTIAIVGPQKQQKEYLRLLASISKNIKNTNILSEMASAKTKAALIESFSKGTISLDETNQKKVKAKNKLLIINLQENKYFDDIIHHLLEEEISDALVTDSMSVESYLADSPLFSGFLNFLAERGGSCKTIMVPVNEEQIPKLTEEIEAIMGDLDTHTGIQLIAFDICFIKGAL